MEENESTQAGVNSTRPAVQAMMSRSPDCYRQILVKNPANLWFIHHFHYWRNWQPEKLTQFHEIHTV